MSRSKRRLMLFVIILIGLYGLLCLLLYSGQERMIFPAYQLPQDYRFSFPTPFEEIFLETEDGARLNMAYFPTQGTPKASLLYFHGNGGALDEWGSIAETFTRQGLAVLVPDYRGYGKSTGKRSQHALLKDALQAYDWLHSQQPERPIYVFGRSLGSGFATYVASQRAVHRVLLETPYYALRDVAQGRFPWLPVGPLLRFPMPSHQYLSTVKVPVHIIHGDADRVIPVQNSRRLKDLLHKGQVAYVEIPEGTHNDLSSFPAYQKWLEDAFR